ncbi:hypothetical protein N657DRAFT_626317 [Parathielavia appendiculata]|uniref:Uncharacterized protein n=1 Tax=Parathielavia appendiculata TaxID=2587402 RepID=A0AAN6TTH2_9PEZI|nr:hypothetical protein N657DRAFT_626317 [Parathielavia appendiculata]
MASSASRSSTNNSYSPPFPHPEAQLGGTPTPLPDVPLSIIFLALYTLALLLSLLLLSLDHTLTPSTKPHYRHLQLLPSLVITLLLTRLAALSTRLAWAYQPSSLELDIAFTTISQAGTILLLIANLLIARRFLRDYTLFGTHIAVVRVARAAIFCAVVSLVMGVSVHVDAYFTRDEETLQRCRVIGLVAWCIRLVVAVVPLVAVVVGGWVFPLVREDEGDRRRFRARGGLMCAVGALLTLEEGFRTGVAFEGRGVGSRAWFLHKACLYCLVFLVEAMIVYGLLAAKLDPRFRSRPNELAKRDGVEPQRAEGTRSGWLQIHINNQTEVFGGSS